ncbi:MAG: hypothetical protein VX910_12850 [Candidatus Latescibacterota bacterium]|nr:hypothetical protein [Candidatus Latescibacterota bacterium]
MVIALLVSVISGCGTTDPSPVGIDLVDLVGGDVVEVREIPATEARSQFREIFPSVLGGAEELLVGRMNGVNFVSLYEMVFDASDLPSAVGGALQVDSLFVELKILGTLSRGTLDRLTVTLPQEAWTETRAFVDTTDYLASSFQRLKIGEALPSQINSTIRVSLPTSLMQNALQISPTTPVVEFGLSGASDSGNFLIVTAAADTIGSVNAAELVAYVSSASGSWISRAKSTKDTYFAEKDSDPEPGEILLQTGVFSAGVIRFDLPTIPEAATVNVVEMTMDFDFDRSFLSSLRLRIEQISVVDGDTTAAVVSGNPLNEQVVTPVLSPFVLRLDQLLFHGWMSGKSTNHGLIINPIFDIVPDVRYEWALLSNPRLRIIYSLPPLTGSLE